MKLARLATLLAVTSISLAAGAQPTAEGFALDRFEPSERGSDWFVGESLDLRGHQRFAAGLVLDYAYKPLVIYTPDGDERAAIVENQLFGHIGGALILWDRVRFAVNFPIAIYQNGDGGDVGGTRFSSENATTVGDLRVGGDVRFAGEYGDPVTAAGGVQIWAPTGSQDSYTGDGTLRVRPRLMLAGDVSEFTYAAQLGVNVRPNDDSFANNPKGSEIFFAVAAGARLADDKVVVGPELHTSTVFTDSDAFFDRQTTPVELLIGAHYRIADSWRAGLGVGPGMTRAFGTPKLRALASIEWVEPLPKKAEPPPVEPPPPPDRDGDGVLDPDDACPDVPGVRTDDPKTNGCPKVEPKVEAPPDRDGDGVIDPEDACPDEPGDKTDDPKTNGCPPPKDRDGDGIVDAEDACPDAPGPINEDPKKNGCPIARVEKGQIRIREQVQFAYNSATILEASNFILEAVKNILETNPGIKKVQVQGHTDSKGGDAYNLALSKRRAQSVMNWLTKNGIDKARLESKGFGEAEPIDTNDTEVGRANNRRVEFHIVAQEGEVKEGASAGREPEKKP